MTEIVNPSPNQSKWEEHVLAKPWDASENERVECGFAISDERMQAIARQLGCMSLSEYEWVEKPEYDPFDEMADQIKSHVIGQDHAVDEIMLALSNTELRDPRRPVASFLFVGPTGVGKTELSKELHRVLHSDEDDKVEMLRIDCSNFTHGHEVASLTGAPPGYVGRDQTPVLAKKRVSGENKVIVFDEIEKAAPELHKLLLQVMEEGELEMNNGPKASFRNAIIIMTTNVGANRMQHELSRSKSGFRVDDGGVVDEKSLDAIVMNSVKEAFAPEFINRIDCKVPFRALDDEKLSEVIRSHIDRLNERYLDKGIKLHVTDELRSAFVQSASDRREYGARHVVREFEKKVARRMATDLRLGAIKRGSIVCAVHDPELTVAEGEVPFRFLTKHDPELLEAYQNTVGYKQENAIPWQSLASQEAGAAKDDSDPLPDTTD